MMLQDKGFKIERRCGQTKHFAQLTATENAYFLCG
jgi:hypothetical protein